MLLHVFLWEELEVCLSVSCFFFFSNVGALEGKFQVACSFHKAPCDLCQFK